MERFRHLILLPTLLALGLWFGGCDPDETSPDTTPGGDVVAMDVTTALDTPAPMDTLTDTPPMEDAAPDQMVTQDVSDTQDMSTDGDGWMDALSDWTDLVELDISLDAPALDIDVLDLALDVSVTPEACCLSDEDCADVGDGGWTCAWGTMEAENPAWGRCMGPLTWEEGLCWDDGDCLAGDTCVGASYCPCDMGCGMADSPGQCKAPEELGDVGDPCGQSGGDCKPGLVCCYPCGIPDCEWQCSEPCDPEEPWCEGGCPLLA